MLCRGPPKGHSTASAISFINPNQDYQDICKKLYLAFNRPKGAAPSNIALSNLQLFALFYGTDYYMGQIVYFP